MSSKLIGLAFQLVLRRIAIPMLAAFSFFTATRYVPARVKVIVAFFSSADTP
jgi:hypothetical protein